MTRSDSSRMMNAAAMTRSDFNHVGRMARTQQQYRAPPNTASQFGRQPSIPRTQTNFARTRAPFDYHDPMMTTRSPFVGDYDPAMTTRSPFSGGDYDPAMTTRAPFSGGDYDPAMTTRAPFSGSYYDPAMATRAPFSGGDYDPTMTTRSPFDYESVMSTRSSFPRGTPSTRSQFPLPVYNRY
jgi:hypothetical protein